MLYKIKYKMRNGEEVEMWARGVAHYKKICLGIELFGYKIVSIKTIKRGGLCIN